jgi:hypothetical protein
MALLNFGGKKNLKDIWFLNRLLVVEKLLWFPVLLHGLNTLPNWDYDKAIIWITFSDTLAMQSKDKFKEYFANDLSNDLLTINDLQRGKLFKNDILFVNWQKLSFKISRNKSN